MDKLRNMAINKLLDWYKNKEFEAAWRVLLWYSLIKDFTKMDKLRKTTSRVSRQEAEMDKLRKLSPDVVAWLAKMDKLRKFMDKLRKNG